MNRRALVMCGLPLILAALMAAGCQTAPATTTAQPAAPVVANKKAVDPAALCVGFGRETLWGTWKTDAWLADDVDVRAFVAGNGGKPTAALAAADFLSMRPTTCDRLRSKIAAELGIPASTVGIFATHDHTSTSDGPRVDANRLDQAFVNAVKRGLAEVGR